MNYEELEAARNEICNQRSKQWRKLFG
jgi:hypothetical protein